MIFFSTETQSFTEKSLRPLQTLSVKK